MKSIGAFEAKTHFSQYLDEVEKGVEVVITRRGQPVALLIPYPSKRVDFMTNIQSFRQRHSIDKRGITLEEIQSFKNEGRR